jgi:hypothetical protein
MKDAKSVGWLAVIGVIIWVLSFFYSRRDKAREEQEKTAENRPTVSIRNGKLVSREIFNGEDSAVAQFTLVNNGNRVAAGTSITLTKGIVLQDGFSLHVPVADIAPNDDAQARVRVAFKLLGYQGRGRERFEGRLSYRDKLDFSRDFEERFCFETPFTIGINGLSTPTALPLVSYSPPLQMQPCSSPWLTPFKSKPK